MFEDEKDGVAAVHARRTPKDLRNRENREAPTGRDASELY